MTPADPSQPATSPAQPYLGPIPIAGDEARLWAMLAHLTSLAGYSVIVGHFIGPLIVWLMKKDSHPFVDDQGKESINFQITTLIAAACCAPLFCIFIGAPLLGVVAIAHLIFTIIATVESYKGAPYRYPVNIRFIK